MAWYWWLVVPATALFFVWVAFSTRRAPMDHVQQLQTWNRWKERQEIALNAEEKATQLGVAALKSAGIINGGGAIALLAFAGQVIKEVPVVENVSLMVPLRQLIWGVLATSVATAFAYFSTFFEAVYHGHDTHAPGKAQRWLTFAQASLVVAVALTVAAYVFFIDGMIEAADVIEKMLKSKPSPADPIT